MPRLQRVAVALLVLCGCPPASPPLDSFESLGYVVVSECLDCVAGEGEADRTRTLSLRPPWNVVADLRPGWAATEQSRGSRRSVLLLRNDRECKLWAELTLEPAEGCSGASLAECAAAASGLEHPPRPVAIGSHLALEAVRRVEQRFYVPEEEVDPTLECVERTLLLETPSGVLACALLVVNGCERKYRAEHEAFCASIRPR